MYRMNRYAADMLAMVLLLATSTAFAQKDIDTPAQTLSGDPVAGKSKSLLCQGCHGEDGNSLTDLVPKLAGQNAGYILKQVHNFQGGIRKHAIMNDLAVTVNDQDLADIAAYFESLPMMKGTGTDNKIGKELFLKGDLSRKVVACVNCHGKNGKGINPNASMFPVIGGQNKAYLSRQLMNFRKDERNNSPNKIMNKITHKLTDAEIEGLADYVSGL